MCGKGASHYLCNDGHGKAEKGWVFVLDLSLRQREAASGEIASTGENLRN